MLSCHINLNISTHLQLNPRLKQWASRLLLLPCSPQWNSSIFLISLDSGTIHPETWVSFFSPWLRSFTAYNFTSWVCSDSFHIYLSHCHHPFQALHLLPSWWESSDWTWFFFPLLSSVLGRWIFLIKCKYNNFITLLKNMFSGFLFAGVLSSNF